MTKSLPLLVFSDLDGTLLDHGTYSWQKARPALDHLNAFGAGVVLASSKTAAEIQAIQADMGLQAFPAIVENGAGILWPGKPLPEDRADYLRLRRALKNAPQGFRGFGDMDIAEIARLTGLTETAAALARQRAFSEPGLWTGPPEDLPAFETALARQGIQARQGGRFLTLSFGRTKADAMAEVIRALSPRTTIALGDAPNDVELIEAADHGVIVANPHGPGVPTLPGEAKGRILRTRQPGPAGWADAILTLTNAMTTDERPQ